MHDNPQKIMKTAFDVEEFRKRNSRPVSGQQSSVHQTQTPQDDTASAFSMDAPEYVFRDNIDVEDFVHMQSINQYKFKINMRQFDRVMALKLPYVFDGPNLRRFNAEDNLKKGFWQRIPLTGSG